MKNSILIVLLFLLLHPFVIAQESPSSKKNELSLDILSFTRNNTIPGIIYKRKFKNAAFRIKLNSSFKSNELNNTAPSPDSLISTIKTDKQNSSSSNQLFIGYERNKHIDSKWSILYGADLIVDFSANNTTEKKVYKTNKGITAITSTVTNKKTSIKYGLSPFVGCNYYFNEYLTVGIESYITALYGIYDVSNTITEVKTSGVEKTVDSTSPTSTELNLSPSTLIVVGYRF